MRRVDNSNEATITFEWLEEEIKKENRNGRSWISNPYFVVEGYYDNWDIKKDEKSPNLEAILNFMHSQSFSLVHIDSPANGNYKMLVFKRNQLS